MRRITSALPRSLPPLLKETGEEAGRGQSNWQAVLPAEETTKRERGQGRMPGADGKKQVRR